MDGGSLDLTAMLTDTVVDLTALAKPPPRRAAGTIPRCTLECHSCIFLYFRAGKVDPANFQSVLEY